MQAGIERISIRTSLQVGENEDGLYPDLSALDSFEISGSESHAMTTHRAAPRGPTGGRRGGEREGCFKLDKNDKSTTSGSLVACWSVAF